MKTGVAHFLKTYPAFVYLLPVFFVFHGYTEHYDFIPAADSLKLTGVYLLAAVILYFISWLFFRNKHKASIFTFMLLSYNFFFGPVHDWLKDILPGWLIVKYSFIFPATFVFFTALLIFLKKRKKAFFTFTRYLNYLFLLFILIDLVHLSTKILLPGKSRITKDSEFNPCTDCPSPDIYLIVADEYAGEQQLIDFFNFDNTGFYSELKKRGFHIIENATSNYNFTHYSIASMMNLEYFEHINGQNSNIEDLNQSINTLKNSRTLKYLSDRGYKIYNYSIFDLNGQPSPARTTFLPLKTQPLISQTLLYRVQKDLWFHLVVTFKFQSAKKDLLYRDKKNNELFLRRTKEAARQKKRDPKFVYTHLMMPHYPFFFDKDGNEYSHKSLSSGTAGGPEKYIGYLQYTNGILLNLIDSVQSGSSKPPVIIVIGDHGYREFKGKFDSKYHFMTLNSVYFPDSNYTGFYKGMSLVNQFRIILNNRFKQKLPLLKDSLIFTVD
jgi:hypothetical protein